MKKPDVKMSKTSIFGPVPSRRLGISLGIDPVPFKTCTFNCVYCECGLTTNETVCRRAFISADEILEQLGVFFQGYSGMPIDFLTFAGSGEPTLNSDIGKMIRRVKAKYPYKVAVITNGSLLWDKQVRTDIMPADIVLPSLDAADEYIFKKINRPFNKIKLDDVIDGLVSFRREFKGMIWLEILFVKGLNDGDEHLLELKNVVARISPDRIQINTIDRPPPEQWAAPPDDERLMFIKRFFGEKSEIVAPFKIDKRVGDVREHGELILELLRRRPETSEGISSALCMQINEVHRQLKILEDRREISREIFNSRVFFYVGGIV